MRAYLTPLWQTDDTVRRIEIPESDAVGVYRGTDGYELYADEPNTTRELSIRDPTVSRKKGGEPPAMFRAVTDGVEIRNHSRATNEIAIQTVNRELSIAPGEKVRVTESGKIELGFNASVRLTIERNRTLTGDELRELVGANSGSVTHAAYARSVATNLRKASTEAPNECLKFATDLHNFLMENPVEAEEYDRITTELNKLVEKLETTVSANALDGSSLNDEQQDRIDRIAHHVTTIYARSS